MLAPTVGIASRVVLPGLPTRGWCEIKIRQSDLASFQRCAQQVKLETIHGEGETLSATVFGTVVHYALMVLEQAFNDGDPQALEKALATFRHYWLPENLPALQAAQGDPPVGVQVWLPRQTYGGLRDRGVRGLEMYFEELKNDTGILLAIEKHFEIPIEVDGETHTLTGTIDRVAMRWYQRKPYISIEDAKTGKKPTYLRFANQWTFYAYASTQPGFWADFNSPEFDELYRKLVAKKLDFMVNPDGLEVMKRKGRWLSFREGFAIHDAGWRTEADYRRLKVHLREYIKAVRGDVFPLTVEGQVCTYCPFARNGMCGGEPLPELEESP